MKDKRNCNMYQGVVPMMPYQGLPNMPIMPTPYNVGYTQGYSSNSITSNTIEEQLNSMENRINSLENRVNRLESMINNTGTSANTNQSKYNNSNYYMV